MSPPFTSILLAGATPSSSGWSTGTHILNYLLSLPASSRPKITIIGRKSSTSDKEKEDFIKMCEGKGAKYVGVDYGNLAELESVLKGVDCVVSTLAVKDPTAIGDAELALIEAAGKAGVRRFFPSQYGADQEATPREKWSPIQERKNRNKELIEKLGMEYTLVVTAMFIDVLWSPLLLWDTSSSEPKVTIVGSGEDNGISCIALKDVGEFVGRMVTAKDPDSTKNKSIRIGGDRVSTLDTIRAYELATGNKVKITSVPLTEATDAQFVFPKLLATSFYDMPRDKWANSLFPEVKASTVNEFAKDKFATK